MNKKEEKTRRIWPSISQELYDRINELAEKESRTFAGQLEFLLKKSLARYSKKEARNA